MEIADREILFRGGKGIAAHEITNRRRRLYFFRRRKMGDRLRSAWPDSIADCRNSKIDRRLRQPPVRLGLGLSVGHRFSTHAMERGASSIHSTESGRSFVA